MFCFAGVPSKPTNLATTQDLRTSIAIQWNSPTDTGNGLPIQNYTVAISELNYSENILCSNSHCSHTYTADGQNVMFNVDYHVEVIAINTCGMKSSPATISHCKYQLRAHLFKIGM